MERKGLIKRVVRYGHGAAAFPMSIMDVLFGSLCLRDETIRGSVIFKVCWEHVNATVLCRIKPGHINTVSGPTIQRWIECGESRGMSYL